MKTQWFGVVLAGLGALGSTTVQAQQSFSEAGEQPYIARKDWQGLLAYNRAWTSAKPDDPMAWYGLGMTYRVGFNEPGKAADAFRRVVTLRPEWPEAWAQLSSAYSQIPGPGADATARQRFSAREGAHAQVLAALRQERQHMSKASVKDWILLGINLRQNGSIIDAQPYHEAVDAFTQALNLDPRSAYAFNDRAAVEHDLGNENAALNDYQRAAQLGLAQAAQSYQQVKQLIAAQIAAEKAEAAKPHCYFPMLATAQEAHAAAAGWCTQQVPE